MIVFRAPMPGARYRGEYHSRTAYLYFFDQITDYLKLPSPLLSLPVNLHEVEAHRATIMINCWNYKLYLAKRSQNYTHERYIYMRHLGC